MASKNETIKALEKEFRKVEKLIKREEAAAKAPKYKIYKKLAANGKLVPYMKQEIEAAGVITKEEQKVIDELLERSAWITMELERVTVDDEEDKQMKADIKEALGDHKPKEFVEVSTFEDEFRKQLGTKISSLSKATQELINASLKESGDTSFNISSALNIIKYILTKVAPKAAAVMAVSQLVYAAIESGVKASSKSFNAFKLLSSYQKSLNQYYSKLTNKGGADKEFAAFVESYKKARKLDDSISSVKKKDFEKFTVLFFKKYMNRDQVKSALLQQIIKKQVKKGEAAIEIEYNFDDDEFTFDDGEINGSGDTINILKNEFGDKKVTDLPLEIELKIDYPGVGKITAKRRAKSESHDFYYSDKYGDISDEDAEALIKKFNKTKTVKFLPCSKIM